MQKKHAFVNGMAAVIEDLDVASGTLYVRTKTHKLHEVYPFTHDVELPEG